MKETDLAYAAGIVDGEGCVCIFKAKARGLKRIYGYRMSVSVKNTNEGLINWLESLFGGGGRKLTGRSNCKDVWTWELYAYKASDFLKLIYSYLRIKRPQADIAIEFQKSKRKGGYRYHPKTEEELAAEEIQASSMRKLNKRGRGG